MPRRLRQQLGRPSSIDRLPADLREMLDDWLRDASVTQIEASARLNDYLAARSKNFRVSHHAVSRYDRRMRRVGERLRESRQIAEAWIDKLGAAPQGAGRVQSGLVGFSRIAVSVSYQVSLVGPRSRVLAHSGCWSTRSCARWPSTYPSSCTKTS